MESQAQEQQYYSINTPSLHAILGLQSPSLLPHRHALSSSKTNVAHIRKKMIILIFINSLIFAQSHSFQKLFMSSWCLDLTMFSFHFSNSELFCTEMEIPGGWGWWDQDSWNKNWAFLGRSGGICPGGVSPRSWCCFHQHSSHHWWN